MARNLSLFIAILLVSCCYCYRQERSQSELGDLRTDTCVCNVECGIDDTLLNQLAIKEDVQALAQKVDYLVHLINSTKNHELGPSFEIIVWSEGGCCVWEYTDTELFFLDGRCLGTVRSRGFNVVTIDRQTGRKFASAVFDTYGSETKENNMAGFIDAAPADSIVLVSIFDSAEIYCREPCTEALSSVGATRSLFGHRSSYALVGYKRPDTLIPFPSWVQEAYAEYPGSTGRDGKQTEPVHVTATVPRA